MAGEGERIQWLLFCVLTAENGSTLASPVMACASEEDAKKYAQARDKAFQVFLRQNIEGVNVTVYDLFNRLGIRAIEHRALPMDVGKNIPLPQEASSIVLPKLELV